MKAIIQYQSDDGHIFNTEAEALAQEVLCRQIALATLPLGPRCDLPGFSSGCGYLQHDPQAVKVCESVFRRLVPCDDKTPISAIGRFHLDGETARTRALHKLYWRLSCIDDQSREWGQPFYAMHPEEGTQKDLMGT